MLNPSDHEGSLVCVCLLINTHCINPWGVVNVLSHNLD